MSSIVFAAVITGAVTADAAATGVSLHGWTARAVLGLLIVLGALEALELLQAVTLPLLRRLEHKIRRSRKGYEQTRDAIDRIVGAARGR